jgi:ribonuclease VapC
MIIDSSALIAILQNEPEAPVFLRAIVLDKTRLLSAANLVETGIVVHARRGDKGGDELDRLLAKYKIEIADLNEEQAQMARRAFRKYGKGHHPAKLNFGDCIAYALARDTGEPLLFKGTDFAKTDIAPVAFDRREQD